MTISKTCPTRSVLSCTVALAPSARLFFFVRTSGRSEKIELADIQFIEACKNYSKLYLPDRTLLTLVPLKRFEEVLPLADFCRIHRSFIVSLAWLRSFDNHTVYGPDRTLTIGEHYLPLLESRVLVLGKHSKPSSRRPKATQVNG